MMYPLGMHIQNIIKKTYLIIIALLLIIAANLINANNEKPAMVILKQEQTININASLFAYINLGLKRLISSTLWIATILESDHEHYKKKDLNSWMFLRFNSISELEPLFYENYEFGGTYLSIIKDDLAGASLIYDKGLAKYPSDFELLRDAGFHYYFEVGNFEKAFAIYNKLIANPKTNQIMISTLARLQTQNGNFIDAYNLLKSKFDEIDDKNSPIAQHINKQLYSIKAEVDLKCLNMIPKTLKCSRNDFNGEPYKLKSNDKKYYATKDWVPFRTNRGPSKEGPLELKKL